MVVRLLLLLVILPLTGCATIRVTDPPRSADEQFLQSEAIRQAIAQFSFSSLRDRRVFLSDQYLMTTDNLQVEGIGAVPEYERLFLLGELRNRMLIEGVELASTIDTSDIVLEVRSGAVGVNRSDFLLGVPGTDVAVGDVEVSGNQIPVILPELAIVKNVKQRGFASVSITAYWRDTGNLVASSGPFVGRTIRTDYWFFGLGPRTSGDIPPVEADE